VQPVSLEARRIHQIVKQVMNANDCSTDIIAFITEKQIRALIKTKKKKHLH